MAPSINRRDIIRLGLSLAATSAIPSALRAADAPATKAGAPPAPFPFYVMDTGLRGPDVPTLEAKVKLAKDLGFSGIDYTWDPAALPRMLALLDKAGIELTAIYLSPKIEGALDPRLADSIRLLKGRPTRVELALQSARFKPSDRAGDESALRLVNQASDWCADAGPVVSIYPHAGAWSERVDDGVRLADRCATAGRKNVGANFNLVHWKWVKQSRPLEQTLRDSLPRLLLVTINGLAGNKIVPLDEGDYDVAGFVAILKRVGYHGRVGLQGYGIPGPSADSLGRSIKQWRAICRSVPA